MEEQDWIMTIETSPEPVFNSNIFEIASSLQTADHGSGGRVNRVLIDLPGLRVLLISLTAGAHVPEHKVAGAITVQPVLGRVQMIAFGLGSEASETQRAQQQYELGVGSLLSLKGGVPHDVRALEESCILVSIVRAIR
jgi:anti-sigma factor ChrR (cupin superfamily)